jgi:hypothetical protein
MGAGYTQAIRKEKRFLPALCRAVQSGKPPFSAPPGH